MSVPAVLRPCPHAGTLSRMDERDVTILMEAMFDIRSDVRHLLDLCREEDGDGQEEEDGES